MFSLENRAKNAWNSFIHLEKGELCEEHATAPMDTKLQAIYFWQSLV